jgi:hypothetical protein
MAIRNFLVFRHTHPTSILLGCKALAFGVQNMAGDNLTLLCLMHVFTTFTCSLKNHVAHNTRSGEAEKWAERRALEHWGEESLARTERRAERGERRETTDCTDHGIQFFAGLCHLAGAPGLMATAFCIKKHTGHIKFADPARTKSCKDEVLQIINYPDHQPLTTHRPPHQPPQKIIR